MRLLPRSPWLRHGLAVAVALWAMRILVRYRVLGWSVASYLPWIGSAVVVLNLILLLNRLVLPSLGEGGIQRAVDRLDFAARLAIVVVAYCAIFVLCNAVLDRSRPALQRAQIEDLGGRTVSAGVPLIYSWASVRTSTEDGDGVRKLVLGPAEQREFWRGESVLLALRGGRFGVPWVMAIARDEEAYCRRALEFAPNAAQPWKDLVRFLFNHDRWAEAASESGRYMETYPNDGEFAYYAGENLDLRGLDVEAVPFLTRAVALRPGRYYFYRLAWVLTRVGDSARAMEALRAASDRYPQAWEFPFLLGYHYVKLRRYPEAIASFERVEALRPGLPEVAATLSRLRAGAVAQRR